MISTGLGRHDPPPTAPGILDNLPAPALKGASRLFIQKAANRLGWIVEGGVVFVHPRLRDDGCGLALDLPLAEVVVERLLQHKTNAALRIRHNQAERDGVDFAESQFIAPQDEPHLWPVAVGDHDALPTTLEHVGNLPGRLIHRIPLVDYLRPAAVGNEGVAADSDDSQSGALWGLLSSAAIWEL